MDLILAHGPDLAVWHWHPHPDVWLLVLGLAFGYVWTVRRFGPHHVSPGEDPVSRSQMALFMLGVASMWVVSDWPIHEIAESHLFSVHMVQHLIYAFVVAPLLLLGIPEWLVRRLIRPRAVFAIVRRITRPVPAMLAFNAFLVLSHWPAFVDLSVRSAPFHAGAHAVLIGVSVLMWWPVLSPIAELPRLSPAAQMLYLFLQTIVPTVPASFLTFADFPFYTSYVEAPRLLGISALADQRAAGLIMKIGGGFYLWAVIAVLFFRWSAREESGIPDARDWQDIERRLNTQEVKR